MKVKMIKTEKGAEDGIHVQTFLEGEEYDMEESLANVFVGEKIAVEVRSMSFAPENKVMGPVPEDKAVEPEPEMKPKLPTLKKKKNGKKKTLKRGKKAQ